MISASDYGQSQGLSDTEWCEAIVVNNDDREFDGRMLSRVQVRVSKLHEGIPDEHLPWAVSSVAHAGGASADSGCCNIPEKGTKVLVRFQNRSPEHPEYRGYVTDEKTALVEAQHNYPDRIVTRLSNGSLVVIDKKENSVYIKQTGVVNVYIEGDANLSVDGNLTEKVKGNKTEYVGGDLLRYVEGNITEKCTAMTYYVQSFQVACSGQMNLKAGAELYLTGSRILENSSAPAIPSLNVSPDSIKMPVWPKIRGKKPDTETTDPEVTY